VTQKENYILYKIMGLLNVIYDIYYDLFLHVHLL